MTSNVVGIVDLLLRASFMGTTYLILKIILAYIIGQFGLGLYAKIQLHGSRGGVQESPND